MSGVPDDEGLLDDIADDLTLLEQQQLEEVTAKMASRWLAESEECFWVRRVPNSYTLYNRDYGLFVRSMKYLGGNI